MNGSFSEFRPLLFRFPFFSALSLYFSLCSSITFHFIPFPEPSKPNDDEKENGSSRARSHFFSSEQFDLVIRLSQSGACHTPISILSGNRRLCLVNCSSVSFDHSLNFASTHVFGSRYFHTIHFNLVLLRAFFSLIVRISIHSNSFTVLHLTEANCLLNCLSAVTTSETYQGETERRTRKKSSEQRVLICICYTFHATVYDVRSI